MVSDQTTPAFRCSANGAGDLLDISEAVMQKWYIASKPLLETGTLMRDFDVCSHAQDVSWTFDCRKEAENARADLLHGHLIRVSSKEKVGEQIECTLRVEEDKGKFVIACIPVSA
jgi:thymidylate synthase ThyX